MTSCIYKAARTIIVQEVFVMKKRGRPPKTRTAGRVDVKLPHGLLKEIEKLLEQQIYTSRSDFVRSAVREKLLATSGTRNSSGS